MSDFKDSILNPAMAFVCRALIEGLFIKMIDKGLLTLDDTRGIIIKCSDSADYVIRTHLTDDKAQADFYEDFKAVLDSTLTLLNLYYTPKTPM